MPSCRPVINRSHKGAIRLINLVVIVVVVQIVAVYIYIYFPNQARGPYRENISARGLDSTHLAALGPYKKRPRADILPVRSRASLVNKIFITRLKLLRRKTQIIDCKDTINFERSIFI